MKAPPRVALIGFMGSGKSTVGSILAKKLGYRFVDLDAEVEKASGMKIADMFRLGGEPAFRVLESECLRSIAGRAGIVLAAGGGTPAQEANREFFRASAATFFLKTPLETALARAGEDGTRPLLSRGREEVRRLFESRSLVYSELGRAVETAGKTPLQIADEILEALAVTTEARDPGGSF